MATEYRLKFVKKNNKWYIDIPWGGNPEDLEMVMGADEMLEELPELFPNERTLLISLGRRNDMEYHLSKTQEEYDGCTYSLWKYSGKFIRQVWLCEVTKWVLGERNKFPYQINFRQIK